MELQNSIRVGICLNIAKEVMKLDSDVLGFWAVGALASCKQPALSLKHLA